MKRILIYSHDTYGLGHLRRSLLIARAFTAAWPGSCVLIATGSPRAQSFEPPAGVDTLKLPAILKRPDGTYAARDLDVPIERIVSMRARLLVSALEDFAPDLVFVDHAPIGVEGELLPLLDRIRTTVPRPRLVLGLRDIIDEADVVRAQWNENGAFKRLADDYDRILVYGCQRILTTARELGLDSLRDADGCRKVAHVGYLARPMPNVAPSGRLLVTAGGGGDGQAMLRVVMGWLERGGRGLNGRGVDIVTGPFLSPRRQEEIIECAARSHLDVRVSTFEPNLETSIAAAAGVIAMAGYNTFVEVLRARVPSLFIPREAPRREQILRCERTARDAHIGWSRIDGVCDARLAEFAAGLGRRTERADLCLEGLSRIADEVEVDAARPIEVEC